MDTAAIKLVEQQQEPLEPDQIVQANTWRPQTIRDVEWALECIADSQDEVAGIDQQLADLIKRATDRAEMLKARAATRATFFTAKVAEFAESCRDDFLVGKKKSRDFVSGRVGWRKKGGKLSVTDKAALSAWVETQDASLYRVKVEADMKAVQEHFKRTGELPPGTEFEPERDEVYVEAVSLKLEGK